MVKINFTERDGMRLDTIVNGEVSNFIGFVTRIMGITSFGDEDKDRFVFLISEGVITRYIMCMSTDFIDIIKHIQLHNIIIVRGSIARIGAPDLFTIDPLIGDFRFEINVTSFMKLISITLRAQDFALLPNIRFEIESEDEELNSRIDLRTFIVKLIYNMILTGT